jgi:DNA-binding CsgD family transcriptional regulator
MDLAVSGLSNREVADRLGLTVHAVKFHLAGVYRKLGVGNRTAAAVLYLGGVQGASSAKGSD